MKKEHKKKSPLKEEKKEEHKDSLEPIEEKKELERRPSISVNNPSNDDNIRIEWEHAKDDVKCCSGNDVSKSFAVLSFQIGFSVCLAGFSITALAVGLPYSTAYGSALLGSLSGYWFSKSKNL